MIEIIIPLAEGFEEIEAITNIDVLRRANLNVTTTTLNNLEVEGTHGITIKADTTLDQINAKDIDGIILPGGLPGATNLRDDQRIVNLVQQLDKDGKLIAAICAAPIVLERTGVIQDKDATSYPGFDNQMKSCHYSKSRVVVNENIITGRGPGVALEFALEIVKYLIDNKKAKELKRAMIAKF